MEQARRESTGFRCDKAILLQRQQREPFAAHVSDVRRCRTAVGVTLAKIRDGSATGSSTLHVHRNNRICRRILGGITSAVVCALSPPSAMRLTIVAWRRINDDNWAFVDVLDTTWILVAASLVDDGDGAFVDVDSFDDWCAPIGVTRLRNIKISVVVSGIVCCVRRCRCRTVGGNDWNRKVSVPTIQGEAAGQCCGVAHFVRRKWHPCNVAVAL